jgi:hypothetical protein
MIIAATTGDKLATSKANYEKIYDRYLAPFNACERHADFVRIG